MILICTNKLANNLFCKLYSADYSKNAYKLSKLHGLYGLYGPQCPLSWKKAVNP